MVLLDTKTEDGVLSHYCALRREGGVGNSFSPSDRSYLHRLSGQWRVFKTLEALEGKTEISPLLFCLEYENTLSLPWRLEDGDHRDY